jgi:hypothetical protein
MDVDILIPEEIPYLDRETLIKSKTTERAQDKVDVQRLLSLDSPDS